jgi:hypothetical protein
LIDNWRFRGIVSLSTEFDMTALTAIAYEALTSGTFDPNAYDRILCAFSGGKDSLACVLHLLSLGVNQFSTGRNSPLIELAGLYHAMRGYLAVHHPSITLDDLRDHTTVPSSSREAK